MRTWLPNFRRLRAPAAAACLTLLAAAPLACASAPTATPSEPAAQPLQLAQARSGGHAAPASVAFEFESTKNSIALLARELSTQSGRSIVVMNGLELTQAGPYEKKKRSAAEWVDQIATDSGLRVERGEAYDFLFAPGYESVTADGIAAKLDKALISRRTDLHIEFGTPLFAALALLGHSLQYAIVADNIVADARCGETRLHDVTAGEALGALLKSARIPSRSILLRSDAESTFLFSAGRPLRDRLHVAAAGSLRPDWMDRRVTLYAPEAPPESAHLQGFGRAVPLSEYLAELKKQTGLGFEADARVLSLPVNPAAMPNVRIETALALIVNQWPLPHFGYRTDGNTVRFVYLGPPIQ